MVAAEIVDITVPLSSPPAYLYDNGQTPDVDQVTKQLKDPTIDNSTFVLLEDGELPHAVKPAAVTPQKQRKRKKSRQDLITAKDENTAGTDKRRRQGNKRDGPSSRDHSRSPPGRGTRRRALREIPSHYLFFVDDKPADIRGPYTTTTPAGPSGTQKYGGLMLPPHVNVADGSSESQEPSLPPFSDAEEGEDFIDYLDVDGDRSIGITRYFHDTREIDTKTRFVCKNCGEEGNHKAKDCPHQICLTCGAKNEHSTRSCPISKTCFTCGMKGHINKTCPNRYASRDDRSFDDCDRCGSRSHYSKECPTLWRIYDYLADRERDMTLEDREMKKDLAFGLGGEGYIGTMDWCFNCGDAGHLGDDCNETPHQHDIPREPSAFSEYNTRSGPFFDSHVPPSKKSDNKPQSEWNNEDHWGDGHGSSLPINVGKQGRKKERQKMETLDARLREEEDDDFFSKNVKDRAIPKNDNKVKRAGIVIKGAAERFSRDPPRQRPPSLQERLGPPQDRHYIDFPRGKDNGSKDKGRHIDRDRGRDKGWDRDRDRDRGRVGDGDRDRGRGKGGSRDRGHDRGPRFRGGYERPR